MLKAVRISAPERVYSAYPHELSGGMGQRAMIAMMLSPGPDLLIADEPTSALDVTVQMQVLAIIDELVTSRGMGLIFISHDLNLVALVLRSRADHVCGTDRRDLSCQRAASGAPPLHARALGLPAARRPTGIGAAGARPRSGLGAVAHGRRERSDALSPRSVGRVWSRRRPVCGRQSRELRRCGRGMVRPRR